MSGKMFIGDVVSSTPAKMAYTRVVTCLENLGHSIHLILKRLFSHCSQDMGTELFYLLFPPLHSQDSKGEIDT